VVFLELNFSGLKIIVWIIQLSWNVWTSPGGKSHKKNVVAVLDHKFKVLRSDLKIWKTSLPSFKTLIENCNKVILSLDNLEE
jgi:hypothetical protein